MPAEEVKHRLQGRRIKTAVVRTIRRFLEDRGFEEAFTPLLVPEVNTEPHIHYFEVEKKLLIASPELELKRCLFDAWAAAPESRPRLFQCGPVFRAGSSERSPVHSNEFLMLEYYHPCPTLSDAIRFFHALLSSAGLAIAGKPMSRPIIMSMNQLFQEATGFELDHTHTRTLLAALESRGQLGCDDTASPWNELFFKVFAAIIDPWLEKQDWIIVTGFPKSITSMAQPDPHQPDTVLRFECFFRGLELCNGYMENFDPHALEEQMNSDLLSIEQKRKLPMNWIQDARLNWQRMKGHVPQMAGVAAGVERIALALALWNDPTTPRDIHHFL